MGFRCLPNILRAMSLPIGLVVDVGRIYVDRAGWGRRVRGGGAFEEGIRAEYREEEGIEEWRWVGYRKGGRGLGHRQERA